MKHVQARHYHRGRTGKIRVIVIHDMEWRETLSTAEDCARMFATMTRQASAHVCVDADSSVRCVKDEDTAWAAPGCNHDGLQLELAGFARQTREQWLDRYSLAMLGQAARVVADWCKLHDIPARKLTVAELKAGKRGIVGHVDVSKAYRRTDHHDPGPNFPWKHFLELVELHLGGKSPAKPKDPLEEIVAALPTLRPGDEHPKHVKTMRALLFARGYEPRNLHGTKYGATPEDLADLTEKVNAFKAARKLAKDGIWGDACWRAALS